MKNRLCFLVLMTILASATYCQSFIIDGNFEDKQAEGYQIQLMRPIGGFVNRFYVYPTDTLTIREGRFEGEMLVNKPGIVILLSPLFEKKLVLYAIPGQNITLYFKRNGDKYRAEFAGALAGIHELLNGTSGLNFEYAGQFVNNLFDRENNPKEIISALEKQIELNILGLDTALAKEDGLEVDTLREKLLDLLTSNYYGKALGRMEYNFRSGRFDKRKATQLVDVILERYDPFSIDYLQQIMGPGAALTYAKYTTEFGIPASVQHQDYWQLYPKNYAPYANMPAPYQEYWMGMGIMIQLLYGMNETDLSKAAAYFALNFPQSKFLEPISFLMNGRIENDLSGTTSDEDTELGNFGYLDIQDDAFVVGNELTETDFSSLIEHQFAGKWVFIDLWATWCLPCLTEFRFAKKLHQFLDEKEIVPLYISVDGIQQKKMWRSYVKRFGLQGYHYFSGNGKSFVDGLIRDVYQGGKFEIPRYFLVNPQGEIVLKNALRPSNEMLLYEQISNAIENR